MDNTQQAQGLSPTAQIQLITFNLTKIGGGFLHICNNASDDVVFNGQHYTSVPVKLGSVAKNANGSPQSPSLEISKLDVDLNQLLNALNDFQGGAVLVQKCFASELNKDAGESFDHGEYLIDASTKYKTHIAFKLLNKMDFGHGILPCRYFRQDHNSTATRVDKR